MIKKSIIITIGVFSIIFLSIIGYFTVNYILDKDFQEDTIQCSNDTEKRRDYFKDEGIKIYENFYSKKLKTCIVIGHKNLKRNGEIFSVRLIIDELYTGKNLESFTLCETNQECILGLDFNYNKIPELSGISKEKLIEICSDEDIDNPLKKFCFIIKIMDGQDKWKSKVDIYR